jgi:hypothetical protein
MTILTPLTEAEFKALKSSQKKEYFDALIKKTNVAFQNAYQARKSETSGFAFLWISLYSKGAITRAFVAYLKKNNDRPIIRNYRGDRQVWYFGSQSSHGYLDGMRAISTVLDEHNIPCCPCDEWD